MAQKSGDPVARSSTMARILNVSEVHLGRLAKEGFIPGPIERGVWNVIAVTNAYLAHVKAEVERRIDRIGDIKSEELRLTAARRAKTEAERDAQERKNAQALGDLVSIEDVAAQVEDEYARVKDRLLSITGKAAARMSGDDCEWIESEIVEALNELHDPGAQGRDGGAARSAPQGRKTRAQATAKAGARGMG